MELSVIIPFHKGIHYLKDCLDSLKEQTIFDSKKFEVIICYDRANGQGDIRGQIKEYEELLPIIFIELTGKTGVAAARNEALNRASGRYIYFLDSDDYLLCDTLELLLHRADKDSADVVYGVTEKTWFKRYSFLQEFSKENSKGKEFFHGWQQPLNYFFHGELSVLNVLFSRRLITDSGLLFNENLLLYCDIPFMAHVLNRCESAVFEESAFYIKRSHNDEINLPSLNQMKRQDRIDLFLSAYDKAIAGACGNQKLLSCIQRMFCRYVIAAFTDMMHSFTRKPVWTKEQFAHVSVPMANVSKELRKEFGMLGSRLLNAAAKGDGAAVMRTGNLIVVKKKKKGLFGNHIQRARAMDRFFFRRLPRKENWIVFESFLGKNYSDSCKYIYEYLLEHYKDKYRFIWVMDKKDAGIPGNPTIVKRFSYAYFYYHARAKYWVNNMRQPLWLEKRSGNIFLETWHGTPLKKLVFDMDDVHSASPSYKAQFYSQSRKWDYLISDNPFSTEVFQSAFLFDKDKILEYGYPRNDIMHRSNRDEIAINIRKKLNIPLDRKTILYAPTWRDDDFYEPGKYKFKLELDLKRFRQELGEEYAILLRTHYFIADQLDITGAEGFAFNVSHYDDISELYLISDICITDYSSVFFDYANMKRPILFFTYDLNKYRDVLRGFYIDMETELPGPLLYTNDDVIDAVKNIERVQEEYRERFDTFYKRFCSLDDGFAAKRVVEKVFLQK